MKAALVLSGGGAKGMVEVGAVDYLLQMADLEITRIAGISTGALQACIYASPFLRDQAREVWDSIKPSEIYRKVPLPLALLGIVFGRGGLYSNAPLRATLEQMINPREFDCPVEVGYVDLDTAAFCVGSSETLPPEKFLDAVWASTSMPLLWPAVEGHLVDGGIRRSLPLGRMISEGVDRIIGIMCSPVEETAFNAAAPRHTVFPHITAFSAEAERVLDIILSQVTASSLQQVLMVNRLVGEASQHGNALHAADGHALRYVPTLLIAPANGTDVGKTLDFSPEWKHKRYVIGQKAAQTALKENPTFGS